MPLALRMAEAADKAKNVTDAAKKTKQVIEKAWAVKDWAETGTNIVQSASPAALTVAVARGSAAVGGWGVDMVNWRRTKKGQDQLPVVCKRGAEAAGALAGGLPCAALTGSPTGAVLTLGLATRYVRKGMKEIGGALEPASPPRKAPEGGLLTRLKHKFV